MSHSTSNYSGEGRPCWHCRYFTTMLCYGSAAGCALANAAAIRSMPASGCSAFEREVGADDEPGPPGGDGAGRRSLAPPQGPPTLAAPVARLIEWAP